MPTVTGGETLVRMLQLHGVKVAFGMGGFQPLPYYDALARQDLIRHVLVRDEKHGAFAADGYARIANQPAVADATLGPGATNLVSGAAEALGASMPMLLITGEVNTGIAGRAATQESDQFGMLKPTTKASIRVDRIDRLPELVRRAIAASTSGRPGPVHLNIAEDVYHGTHDFDDEDLYVSSDACAVGARRVRAPSEVVDCAAKLLRTARRPLILAGGGVHLSQAYDALAAVVETGGVPVATTISGKGVISEDHPLAAGVFGRFSRCANRLISAADVLLVVGCKLGEIATNRWTLIPASAKVIHIDVDPTELGKVYRTECEVWGDARLVLEDLAVAISDQGGRDPANAQDQLVELQAARDSWDQEASQQLRSSEAPIHMARVLNELRAALPPEAILVADGGFAAHWSVLFFNVLRAGRTYVANRGHAAIGYALPAAIGVKLAAPNTPVVALCGDNGFAMAVAELETAKRAGAPILVVVVNNITLGYVKALQHGLYNDRFMSVDFLDVDYGDVARAFGCHGVRIDRPDDLAVALRDTMDASVPAVIDVMITRDPAKMLPGVDSRTRVAS